MFLCYLCILVTESELNRLHVMSVPERIFNRDESGVNSHVAAKEKAYGAKGEPLYQVKVAIHEKLMTILKGKKQKHKFLILCCEGMHTI